MKKAIASWSSGKDSCLACYKAINMGYEVKYLFNTVSNESKRVNFHGVNTNLLKMQSEAAGIPLSQIETSSDGYTQEFKDAVSGLIKKEGIAAMVFGDIYLQWHKDWIDNVCTELGIEAVMPLWNGNSEEIVREFISLGFEAVVVGVSATHVKDGRKLIGKKIDNEFIAYVKNNIKELKNSSQESDFDLCGENGEYHTFVTSGQLFKKKINILETEQVYREKEYGGKVYGNWFLDIKKAELSDKR